MIVINVTRAECTTIVATTCGSVRRRIRPDDIAVARRYTYSKSRDVWINIDDVSALLLPPIQSIVKQH